MTSTQVRYWQLREDRRHNRASEIQNKYHLATERANAKINKYNAMTQRRASDISKYEAITHRLTATETQRHNKATEQTIPSQIALNTSTAGLRTQQTAESAAKTKLTLTQIDKYDLQMLLTAGPDWAKTIAATAIIGDVLADPSQSKEMKKVAMDVWDKVKNSKTDGKQYLFTANGYDYYAQTMLNSGAMYFTKTKHGSKSSKSTPVSQSQGMQDLRKDKANKIGNALQEDKIVFNRDEAVKRRRTNR